MAMIRNEHNRSFSQDQFRARLRLVLGALVLVGVVAIALGLDTRVAKVAAAAGRPSSSSIRS